MFKFLKLRQKLTLKNLHLDRKDFLSLQSLSKEQRRALYRFFTIVFLTSYTKERRDVALSVRDELMSQSRNDQNTITEELSKGEIIWEKTKATYNKKVGNK